MLIQSLTALSLVTSLSLTSFPFGFLAKNDNPKNNIGQEIKKEAQEMKKNIQEEVKETQKEIKEEVKEMKQDVKGIIQEKVAAIRTLVSGKVALGSGEVTVISGVTLTVSKDGKTYTVSTDSKTKFRRKFWGESNLSEFSVGDKVNVLGKWTDEAKTTVLAHMVRNLSIQKRHAVFVGTVTTINGNILAVNTVNRGTQAVTVSDSTEYRNRKTEKINLSDIQINHKIRVRGLWNSKNNTVTEVTLVKDFFLPPLPSPKAL